MSGLLLPPSEKQLEVIVSSLGEDEESVRENLETLKNWMRSQSHLPDNCDDRMLGLFLRGCKQNVSRTQRKLEAFYTGRAACPELFAGWDPCDEASIKAAANIEIIPLPRLTDDGYRVTVHRLTSNIQTDFNYRDLLRVMLMMGELRINSETVIRGDIYVFDISHLTWTHCTCLLSPLIRRTLSLVQEGYPQRLKQMHLINGPSFVNNVVNIFRGMLKEKMRDRFVIHKSAEGLHDYLQKSIIPQEYGGCGESLKDLSVRWNQALLDSRDNLKNTSALYTSRKTHKSTNNGYSEDQGCQGTFKSIEFD